MNKLESDIKAILVDYRFGTPTGTFPTLEEATEKIIELVIEELKHQVISKAIQNNKVQ